MYQEAGGYKTITPIQIANALGALSAGAITLRSLRVYFGCIELKAIREAAKRSKKLRDGEGRGGELYRVTELVRLLGTVSERVVTSEIRRLERAGLMTFMSSAIALSETLLPAAASILTDLSARGKGTRPIPIPRRALRFLCRCRKPALVKTFLAYVLRGLSLDRKSSEVRSAGTVKVSWISCVFELSERAVRAARRELIQLGWITKDTGSIQRKLNRDGSYFQINLAWEGEGRVPHNGSEASPVVDNSEAVREAEFAPPSAEKQAEFAPPIERPKTPYGLKNQKLTSPERAGFCGKGRKPDLRNIQPEDLRRVSRLTELYEQATKAEWLERSEASFLRFAAAAVRANRVTGHPVRIFVALVRKGLQHHITVQEEERARKAVRCYAERQEAGRDRVRSQEQNVNALVLDLVKKML